MTTLIIYFIIGLCWSQYAVKQQRKAHGETNIALCRFMNGVLWPAAMFLALLDFTNYR